MKNLPAYAKPVSWASLLLIILPPILFFTGGIGAPLMNQLLLAGTFIWFLSASLWMKSE
ncbi:MAG: hypothetical protein H7A51_02630 [Akkermansiaceae bacterium]|nr:hypothetical protein [Akkermansiaceae bacterium]